MPGAPPATALTRQLVASVASGLPVGLMSTSPGPPPPLGFTRLGDRPLAGDRGRWSVPVPWEERGAVHGFLRARGCPATLCADRFTAADIAIGYALRLAGTIGLARDFGPNVGAYWARLQERDGYKRAVAAEQEAGVEQNVAPRVQG